MAEAILFAVKNLDDLLIHQADFLQGVEEQVKSLKDELKRMQCFMKDAAEKQDSYERIHKWISDLRDVAHDANYIIEAFVLKAEAARRNKGLPGKLLYSSKKFYQLKQIERIRAKLRDIGRSRERFGIQNASMRSEEDAIEWRQRNILLGKKTNTWRAWKKTRSCCFKTNLARKLIDLTAVADRFDRRAWVVVSDGFTAKDVMKELVLQLLDPSEDKLKEAESGEIIHANFVLPN